MTKFAVKEEDIYSTSYCSVAKERRKVKKIYTSVQHNVNKFINKKEWSILDFQSGSFPYLSNCSG